MSCRAIRTAQPLSVPTPAVQDLTHTRGITIRLVSTGAVLPLLQRDFGGVYFAATVAPGAYPGIDRAVPVIGSSNVRSRRWC